jgi:hypothetical protein
MTPTPLAANVLTFTDTGSVTPSGALPPVNTTGNVTATQFTGPGTGLTGTAASLTAGTATNALSLGGKSVANLTPTITQNAGSAGGDYTTSSTTYVDVDGTNLAYIVTVTVGYRARIDVVCITEPADAFGMWVAIADGSTPLREALVTGIASDYAPISLSHIFVGNGTSHTFKIRYLKSTSGTASIRNRTATDAPVMIVTLTPSN